MTQEKEILDLAEILWGDRPLERIALKLAEESGEICGAAIKMSEGRASLDDLAEEIGDALFVISQLSAKLGTTNSALLRLAYEKNSAKLHSDASVAVPDSKKSASDEKTDLQSVQSAYQRRKANKKRQMILDL